MPFFGPAKTFGKEPEKQKAGHTKVPFGRAQIEGSGKGALYGERQCLLQTRATPGKKKIER